MDDIIQKVKDKIKSIEELRRKKSEQDGEKSQLLKQLKDASGTVSIVEAEKKLQSLSLELITNEKSLKKLGEEMDVIIAEATPEEN